MAEVRAAAAELAVEVAGAVLTKRALGLKADPMIDQAVSDLSVKFQ